MKKRMIVIVLFVGLFIPGSTFAETAKEYTQGYNYLDEAISEFTRAIENSPNYAGAYYNRAVAYIHKGNYDQAISDCTKAIELKPNYAEAYYFRGVAYGGKGNSVQEASDYARAAELKPELNPKYVKSNKGLGLAYPVSQTQNSISQEDQITGEEYAIYSRQLETSMFGGFKPKSYIVIPNQTTITATQFNSSLSIFDSLLASIKIDEDEKDMSSKLSSLNEKTYKIEDKFDKSAHVYFISDAEYQNFKKDENGNFDWEKIEQKYPDAAFFNISRVAFNNDKNDAFFYFLIENKSGTQTYYLKFYKTTDQYFGFEGWSCGASVKVR